VPTARSVFCKNFILPVGTSLNSSIANKIVMPCGKCVVPRFWRRAVSRVAVHRGGGGFPFKIVWGISVLRLSWPQCEGGDI
jgi:hypothetical protein